MDYSYRGERPPGRLNLARYCIGVPAEQDPGKTALIVVEDLDDPSARQTWTYGHLDRAVRRFGQGLRDSGLEPGDRILVRMRNTTEFALVYFGAMSAGIVPIPSSEQLSPREVAYILEDSGAAAVALSDGLDMPDDHSDVSVIRETDLDAFHVLPVPDYADTDAEDPAFLIYTSGTSGNPKGVLHAHRSIWGRRPMYDGWYGITAADVMVHAGAFNWTYTLGVGISDPLANGATTVVYTGTKEPGVWPRLVNLVSGTIFASVPSIYRQMMKYCPHGGLDMPTLRHCLTAGEPMPVDVASEWIKRTGKPLYEALGMSEISTYVSCSPTVPVKSGSPGRAQPGRSVAILPLANGRDEPLDAGQSGLLAVHRTDPGLMLRYWNRPGETAATYRGDWFVGGDVASMDEDGYVWFEGRADDIMNAMGYRVSPAEVEAVIAECAFISECAVTEIEVRHNVSVIAAFVVPEPGCKVDRDALLAHAQSRLARYKCPREVVVVENLPRTGNGKLVRKTLKQVYATMTAGKTS